MSQKSCALTLGDIFMSESPKSSLSSPSPVPSVSLYSQSDCIPCRMADRMIELAEDSEVSLFGLRNGACV